MESEQRPRQLEAHYKNYKRSATQLIRRLSPVAGRMDLRLGLTWEGKGEAVE